MLSCRRLYLRAWGSQGSDGCLECHGGFDREAAGATEFMANLWVFRNCWGVLIRAYSLQVRELQLMGFMGLGLRALAWAGGVRSNTTLKKAYSLNPKP